jgi:hypothetical protein
MLKRVPKSIWQFDALRTNSLFEHWTGSGGNRGTMKWDGYDSFTAAASY